MKDCTFLLSSYDGGEDLWVGFFTALKAEWKGFDMPIVLNTESKKFAFEDLDITTYSLYPNGKKVAWAKRLIETLKRIDTEYVLFFLDDFWLDAPVDVKHFEKTLSYMRENKDVACISYQNTPSNNIKDGRFEGFEKRPQKAEYRMNCQSALWRREKLISFLRPHESPWEWEIYGSIRSKRYKDGLYSLIDGEKKIFSYDLVMGGVIHRGRWNSAVVKPINEKYKLNIDFSIRGFHEDWVASKSKRKRNLWRGIKNRINIIKSLI